jgi:hypothetical protein
LFNGIVTPQFLTAARLTTTWKHRHGGSRLSQRNLFGLGRPWILFIVSQEGYCRRCDGFAGCVIIHTKIGTRAGDVFVTEVLRPLPCPALTRRSLSAKPVTA